MEGRSGNCREWDRLLGEGVRLLGTEVEEEEGGEKERREQRKDTRRR